MDDPDWKPFSLTHVQYKPGDFVGLVLALVSLSPIFIVVGFATHIFFRREIHTICFLLGILANEAFNFVLKFTVKEPRPDSGHKAHHVEYGWPSSHAQFIWFFAAYGILFCYIRIHHGTTILDSIWKHSVCFIGLLLACLVCWSRVYLEYHTISQVLWGSLIGSVLGVSYFVFVHLVLTPHFTTVVNLKICELFLIRDSTLIPNIMLFEYTASRHETRQRLRKTSKKHG